jgi:hypothetical protein
LAEAECPVSRHGVVVRRRGPLLVVTGAAAAGKSTVCASLAGRPGMLSLDGDVLAGGAAAVSDGRRDYPAFWRYLLEVAREIAANGLCTAYCGVCLPEQVLANAETGYFAGVHFLALVSGETTVRPGSDNGRARRPPSATWPCTSRSMTHCGRRPCPTRTQSPGSTPLTSVAAIRSPPLTPAPPKSSLRRTRTGRPAGRRANPSDIRTAAKRANG